MEGSKKSEENITLLPNMMQKALKAKMGTRVGFSSLFKVRFFGRFFYENNSKTIMEP